MFQRLRMGNLTLHVTVTQPENNQQSIEDVEGLQETGESEASLLPSVIMDVVIDPTLGEESNGEEMTISSIEEESLESSGGDTSQTGTAPLDPSEDTALSGDATLSEDTMKPSV